MMVLFLSFSQFLIQSDTRTLCSNRRCKNIDYRKVYKASEKFWVRATQINEIDLYSTALGKPGSCINRWYIKYGAPIKYPLLKEICLNFWQFLVSAQEAPAPPPKKNENQYLLRRQYKYVVSKQNFEMREKCGVKSARVFYTDLGKLNLLMIILF